MTPNSSTSAFCTPTQFVAIFDYRTVAQLLSDTDVPLATQSAVINSAVLAELLMEAAGQIEMATSIGNRYQVYTDGTPSDLTVLAGTSTVMASRLHRLNAAIAMEYCWRRRPDKKMPDMKEFEEANLMLKALAEGEAVFGFVETMDAGIMQHSIDTPQDVVNRNLPTYTARNLFGTRGNRIPRWPN